MYNHMMTIYGSKLTSVCTNTIHLIGSYIHVMGIKLIKLDSKTQILFVAIKFKCRSLIMHMLIITGIRLDIKNSTILL